MRVLNKTLSLVLGGVAASVLTVSIVAAPAFADNPVSRTETGSYQEVVPYSSGNEGKTVSTEVLINSEFHFLDYTPEIDVTYSWDEELEWVYIRRGKYGLWFKGESLATALDNLKDIAGERAKDVESFDDVTDETLIWLTNQFKTFNNTALTCRLITFENNAPHEVNVTLEAQSQTLPTATVRGETYPQANIPSSHMEYRRMRPTTGVTNTTVSPLDYSATDHVTIGTNTSMVENFPLNKAIIGLSPKTGFRPNDYSPWIAANRGGSVVQAQIKIFFSKVDD